MLRLVGVLLAAHGGCAFQPLAAQRRALLVAWPSSSALAAPRGAFAHVAAAHAATAPRRRAGRPLRGNRGEEDFGAAGGVEAGAVAGEGLKGAATAVYKFLRPHTIRGTILASVTGVARALVEVPLGGVHWLALLPNALYGMLALLLGNAFIVGINQIYDVDIDKVNKPFLPVAAGELSARRAWALVVSSAVLGPLIVYTHFSSLIFKLYMFGTTVGCLYSVPPFRLKQHPLAAGLTIATVIVTMEKETSLH